MLCLRFDIGRFFIEAITGCLPGLRHYGRRRVKDPYCSSGFFSQNQFREDNFIMFTSIK